VKARVYKSTGSWYTVKNTDHQFLQARVRGIFKIEGLTSTNPIAVGDWVELQMEEGPEKTAVITKVFDRENYVARQSPHNKHQHHIVGSNLHQSLLFATLRDPKTSNGFIDRFLLGCEAHHVPAIIVFNKADLYRSKEMDLFAYWQQVYTAIGYRVILASMHQLLGIEEIKAALAHKTTLLSGHSGVGKSSLINAIFPELTLRTQEVSDWSGKGLHTTTFAEMFDLPFGGSIIDTPGVREFGIVQIEKTELSGYFPEMRALLQQCQFNNCIHLQEPGCAIKKAVVDAQISEERYLSYLSILDSIAYKKY
jgi:ribosome biogenesis GTPase / thiamine phosphate phosphatase